MTRHFSQFLFAPYGDGEGLRAVERHPADEQLLRARSSEARPAAEPSEAVAEASDVAATDMAATEAAATDPSGSAVVEWPLTHRPFDGDEPELPVGRLVPAHEDPDAESREEAAAHAARAALLAEVYGWPHRAV